MESSRQHLTRSCTYAGLNLRSKTFPTVVAYFMHGMNEIHSTFSTKVVVRANVTRRSRFGVFLTPKRLRVVPCVLHGNQEAYSRYRPSKARTLHSPSNASHILPRKADCLHSPTSANHILQARLLAFANQGYFTHPPVRQGYLPIQHFSPERHPERREKEVIEGRYV